MMWLRPYRPHAPVLAKLRSEKNPGASSIASAIFRAGAPKGGVWSPGTTNQMRALTTCRQPADCSSFCPAILSAASRHARNVWTYWTAARWRSPEPPLPEGENNVLDFTHSRILHFHPRTVGDDPVAHHFGSIEDAALTKPKTSCASVALTRAARRRR